ncbi:MAG: hypothetical protein L0Y44_03745 [Phycisphaerales bacterium]|nr:hypothetical protein [Phycisphaerales bacterium]MCI0674403.1 hypothetical protein [Phycisphaerales bacterium]
MLSAMRPLLGLVVGMAWGGCHAPALAPESLQELENAPGDFVVELAVVEGDPSDEAGEARAVQTVYVLWPDGSLHHGVDRVRVREADWLPPLVRVLGRKEMDEVWLKVRELRLVQPGRLDEPMNFKLAIPGASEAMHVGKFAGAQRRWSIVERSYVHDSFVSPLQKLAQYLAELAWVGERGDDGRRSSPPRRGGGPGEQE